MITLEKCQNVFEGKGFLSNYESNKGYFSTTPCGHISLKNPIKLLKRIIKHNYFYDRMLFSSMLDGKIDVTKNQDIVFSDWECKVYNTPEELLEYTKKNSDFDYVEYAK